MGTTSKVISVILRVVELCCAAIVAGIVGQYLRYLTVAGAGAGSRIIFTEVIAGISILVAIIYMPPLKYSFYGFVIDLALFICWMVAFGLLVNLSGGGGCNSYWYWSSWGYYWGGYWYSVPYGSATQSLVGTAACSQWRATISFCFIGGWFWLLSGLLGIYVCMRDAEARKSGTSQADMVSGTTHMRHWFHKKDDKQEVPA